MAASTASQMVTKMVDMWVVSKAASTVDQSGCWMAPSTASQMVTKMVEMWVVSKAASTVDQSGC